MAAVSGSGMVKVAANVPSVATANADYMAALSGTGIAKVTAAVPGLALAADLSAPVYAAAAGTNTITAALAPAIAGYTVGTLYRFQAANNNTDVVTVNFNGVGPIPLKKLLNGIATDLTERDIRAGQMVECVYDGTNFQMVSPLANSSGVHAYAATALFLGGVSQNVYPVAKFINALLLGSGTVVVYCDATNSPSTAVAFGDSTGYLTLSFVVLPQYYFTVAVLSGSFTASQVFWS